MSSILLVVRTAACPITQWPNIASGSSPLDEKTTCHKFTWVTAEKTIEARTRTVTSARMKSAMICLLRSAILMCVSSFLAFASCLPGKAARQGNKLVVCVAPVGAGSAGDSSDDCAPAIRTDTG